MDSFHVLATVEEAVKSTSTLYTMRLLSFLKFSLVAATALAASDVSNARFNKFLKKSLTSSPLKLDDATFDELTKTPRDYYVLTLLTAMPAQFGCMLCKQFQPEFDLLGKSWINGDKKGKSRILFGTLDFPDGRVTFQKVCRIYGIRIEATDKKI